MHRPRVTTVLPLALVAAALLLAPARSAAQSTYRNVWTSSADIAEAQRILEYRQYLAPASYKSGSLDDATSHALRAFQTDHHLRPNGMLDTETFAELLQHRPGKDADGDGVPDIRDKCPNTPKGARVDANGCTKDADGDGVVDGVDRCPGTPQGAKVDGDGCPLDSDGDGVYDGLDQCPDTPRGTRVDSRGCAQDSDGDGVEDANDKCPNTARGAKVGSDGCPSETDGDGDGVNDDRDRCPDTPRGSKVDAQGCPEKAAAPPPAAAAAAPVIPEARKSLVLEGVSFETNSSRLTGTSTEVLDRVADGLKSNPDVKVEIGGHTDSQGDEAYNMRLSRDRANAVRDYLVGKGVDKSQLDTKGYGESKPIADNKTAGGRAVNRRVELKRD